MIFISKRIDMKTTDKNFEEMVANITKKVVDYIMKMDEKLVRIEALVGLTFPELRIPSDYSNIERYIIMGQDFFELTTKEKLIAIKSAIHTHYRVTDKIIIGLGEIAYYELQFTKRNKEYNVLFSTDGTILDEKEEQYL